MITEQNKTNITENFTLNIKFDSSIYTDERKGYNELEYFNNEYLTVNHSKEFKNKTNGCHTNSIEGTCAAVKANVSLKIRAKEKINWLIPRKGCH